MDQLTNWVTQANEFLWGVPLIALLAGVGLIATIYLKFPQLRYMWRGIKDVLGIGGSSDDDHEEGSMSSFQALATAVAAQVGTGNIVGVSTAIVGGGPGAVFWMWVLAFLGMATIQVEAILAQKYRNRNSDGELIGGPAYYISQGLAGKGLEGLGKFLGAFFAIAIVIALGLVGNAVQSNSIATGLDTAFGVPAIVTGIILAIICAFVFVGGMGRIAKLTELIVPIMAAFYIIGSIIALFIFRSQIGPVVSAIFRGAFTSEAVLAGVAGYTVREAIRFGAARGLFANEAGMGSTPNSHATARTEHPVKQGMAALVGVLVVMLICTATAVVVLASGTLAEVDSLGLEGPQIAMHAFDKAFGGFGSKFVALALTFFAFSTIVGWHYFGASNVQYLTNNSKTAMNVYRVLAIAIIVLGCLQEVGLVWELADFFNALMVIPNVIGLLILMPEAKEMMDDYDRQFASGKPLFYEYQYESVVRG